MKIITQIRKKSSTFLVGLILILCAGFAFISCGTNPQLKVDLVDAGIFAVDFNSSAQVSVLYIADPGLVSIANTELTVEAWVKSKAANLTGSILTRYKEGGLSLYVKDGVPKFRVNAGSNTGTERAVSSGVTLTVDEWTHVAGVLVNEAHTHAVTATSCTVAVMAQTPHLDIYINGVFKECATSTSASGSFAKNDVTDNEGNFQIFIGLMPLDIGTAAEGCPGDAKPGIDGICHDIQFNGVIDEIRFWTTARTGAEIAGCMNGMLDFSKGTCGRNSSFLNGYWIMNEGKGDTVNDVSGEGYAGNLKSPFEDENNVWPGVWTAGRL